MPTSRDGDVIPVRKATKVKLAAAKREESYDELVSALLELTPIEDLRAFLDAKREAARERVLAFQRRAEAPGPGRTASKQRLIARLARERWRLWEEEGRIERLGPRATRWNVAQSGPLERRSFRIVRGPRGASPP